MTPTWLVLYYFNLSLAHQSFSLHFFVFEGRLSSHSVTQNTHLFSSTFGLIFLGLQGHCGGMFVLACHFLATCHHSVTQLMAIIYSTVDMSITCQVNQRHSLLSIINALPTFSYRFLVEICEGKHVNCCLPSSFLWSPRWAPPGRWSIYK